MIPDWFALTWIGGWFAILSVILGVTLLEDYKHPSEIIVSIGTPIVAKIYSNQH